MNPSEFLDLAFGLLTQVNEATVDQYFTDDPSGITYVRVELSIFSKTMINLKMNALWSDERTLEYAAKGSIEWNSKISHLLLENPV